MTRLFSIPLAVSLLSLSAAAFAANPCGDLQVQIVNWSGSDCHLETQDLRHGTLKSLPPYSIPKGKSRTFTITETVFVGSDIVLTLHCGGDNMVKIESEQRYCALAFAGAGSPHGTVLASPDGMGAVWLAMSGSWYRKTPGHITWQIHTTE